MSLFFNLKQQLQSLIIITFQILTPPLYNKNFQHSNLLLEKLYNINKKTKNASTHIRPWYLKETLVLINILNVS